MTGERATKASRCTNILRGIYSWLRGLFKEKSLFSYPSKGYTKTCHATLGRDGKTRLARPNSQARTGTGEYSFSLFS